MSHSFRPISRREFGLGALSAATLAAPVLSFADNNALTVEKLVERIKARCAAEGVTWRKATVDTLVMGTPQMPVRGIATSFMATSAVIQKAVAAGANFVLSHEPVFWNTFDKTEHLQKSPAYLAKTQLAARHGVAVWRFHDHWHEIKPEPMTTEFAAALDWQRYRVEEKGVGFAIAYQRPAIKLAALAAEMKRKLPSSSIRVIGNRDLPVTRIRWAIHTLDTVVSGLESADVVIAPEVREWDCGEYVRDLVTTGAPKAMIMIAHERGEEAGMDRCADWLRTFVSEAPVRFISAGEPFRSVRV